MSNAGDYIPNTELVNSLMRQIQEKEVYLEEVKRALRTDMKNWRKQQKAIWAESRTAGEYASGVCTGLAKALVLIGGIVPEGSPYFSVGDTVVHTMTGEESDKTTFTVRDVGSEFLISEHGSCFGREYCTKITTEDNSDE